jgi:hypothetical protein
MRTMFSLTEGPGELIATNLPYDAMPQIGHHIGDLKETATVSFADTQGASW